MNSTNTKKIVMVAYLVAMGLVMIALGVGAVVRYDGWWTWVVAFYGVGAGIGAIQMAWRAAKMRDEVGNFSDFLRGLRRQSDLRRAPVDVAAMSEDVFYLRRVELRNIRCFERVDVPFEDPKGTSFTTLLLGNNAVGKSTLLRSMALGLCPETDAAALMRKMKGPFLRTGTKRGRISIYLHSPRSGDAEIHTTITGTSVRQKTVPSEFPWNEVFVCGYGTQRTEHATEDHRAYEPRLSVGSLFSARSPLLNPEVVLLRQSTEDEARLRKILEQVLMVEGTGFSLERSDGVLVVAGPWGQHPLPSISDGFRCTTQWIIDFLGWQILSHRDTIPGGGILIIDEIEQHLHPSWQRLLIQKIREQFPRVQLIASSHTPLTAACIPDLDGGQVIQLGQDENGRVQALRIPDELLRGKRADQILASVFGLDTSRSPGTVSDMKRYAELLGMDERTEAQENRLKQLAEQLEGSWADSETETDQKVEKEVARRLQLELENAAKDVDERVSLRLRELLGERKSE